MQEKSLRELAYLFLDNEMDPETLSSFRTRISTCQVTQRETQFCMQFLALVRQRCPRQAAPRQLRRRIIAILTHSPTREH